MATVYKIKWMVAGLVAALMGIPNVSEANDIFKDMPMYEYRAKIINVVDGDTVDAVIDLGFRVTTTQRLRLARVDTPERGQPKFEEAKEFVQKAVGGKEVYLRSTKVSKYGYYLASITIDGRDLSSMLIETGLAKPYDGGKKGE